MRKRAKTDLEEAPLMEGMSENIYDNNTEAPDNLSAAFMNKSPTSLMSIKAHQTR